MAALVELLGATLDGTDGDLETEAALAEQTAIGLLFVEKDNEDCTTFVAALTAAYENALKSKGLEVVLVSAADNEEEFVALGENMPWPAVPFASADERGALRTRFEVVDLPALVLVNSEGEAITTQGVAKVTEDPEGEQFPWPEAEEDLGPPLITETEKFVRMGPCPPEPGNNDIDQITIKHKDYLPLGLVNCEAKNEDEPFSGMKTKPFIKVNVAMIRAEFKTQGCMSDWYPIQKAVDKYKGEELLLMLDPDRNYGGKFAAALTDAAFAREWARIEERLQEVQDAWDEEHAVAAPGGGGGGGGADEVEAEIALIQDLPWDSRPWKSETMEQTHSEVALMTVHNSRALMQVMISRPRYKFGVVCKISDSGELTQPFCRPQKDPNFILQRKELEIGIQSVRDVRSSSSQTTWHRPVNKSTQYSSEDFKRADDDGDELVDILSAFLTGVSVAVEEALQTNETVDIFQEEFAHLGDDEAGGVSETASNITEYRNFVDVTYTKGKRIEWVEWVPNSVDMLACSCCDVMPFTERMESAGKATTSTILVWYFYEQLNPHIILQSPWEVPVFKFYPSHDHHGWYLLGGCSSGQMIVWKLTDADLGKVKPQRSGKSSPTDMDEKPSAVPIQHRAMSVIDESHRRPVMAIEWLPSTLDKAQGRGKVWEESGDKSGPVKNVLTIAGDGQVMIWDFSLMIDNINEPEFVWKPLQKVQLHRQDSGTEMGCCHILYCDDRYDEKGVKQLTNFYAATEEGELILGDWAARAEEDRKPEVCKRMWDVQKTFRPILSLERSPFFPEIILGVTDWAFYLWKDGLRPHLFHSSYTSTYFARGCWSPTRPSVIFLGNVNGDIDIWDFSDQSHKASLTDKGGQGAISSMCFLTYDKGLSGPNEQKLAVGDAQGHLHVHIIPKNLVRQAGNEKQTMRQFLDREEQRVLYFEKRSRELQEMKEAMEKEEQAAEQKEDDQGDKKNLDQEEREDAAAESVYQKLEAQCLDILKNGPQD